MKDTFPEISQIQKEVFSKMKKSERIKQGVDMIDFVYATTIKKIKKNHYTFREQEIIAELFKEYYRNEYSENELNEIMNFIKGIEK